MKWSGERAHSTPLHLLRALLVASAASIILVRNGAGYQAVCVTSLDIEQSSIIANMTTLTKRPQSAYQCSVILMRLTYHRTFTSSTTKSPSPPRQMDPALLESNGSCPPRDFTSLWNQMDRARIRHFMLGQPQNDFSPIGVHRSVAQHVRVEVWAEWIAADAAESSVEDRSRLLMTYLQNLR
jgi:hypothetical protein